MKLITYIFFIALAILGLNQNLLTSANERNPTNTTNVVIVEKESKESSRFFRNLIICCATFAAGYVTCNIQNFNYIKINQRKSPEKIDFFTAYLYKFGFKKLEMYEAIFKTPCFVTDMIISNPAV